MEVLEGWWDTNDKNQEIKDDETLQGGLQQEETSNNHDDTLPGNQGIKKHLKFRWDQTPNSAIIVL